MLSHPYLNILKLLFSPQIHTSRVRFHETQAVTPKVQREQEKPEAIEISKEKGWGLLGTGLEV